MQYLCALPNEKKLGRIRHLFSDDPDVIAQFARGNNAAGFNIYRCVAALKPGATRRSLDDTGTLDIIHIDIDDRALATPREAVLKALLEIPLALEIRDSGGGFHVLALLKEPAENGTEEFDHVNNLRARLTHILCGDPVPDHAAALLREPGTLNLKYDPPRECRVLRAGKPVDITEVEALAELYDAPLFEPTPKTNGHAPPEGGDANGPTDVGARFAAMQYHGPGDSRIHPTQVSCTASLLRNGVTVECAVAEVLAATRKAVARDPECANWDWAAEQKTIEGMCFDFINTKHPELYELLPDKLLAAWRKRRDAGDEFVRVMWSGYAKQWCVTSRKPRDSAAAGDAGNTGKAEDAGREPKKKPRFQILAFNELRPGPDPACLVDELIPLHGIVVVWGKPKCCKTFFAYGLGLHVARGMEYRGRRVQQRSVVYCAFEGAHGFKNRTEALRRHHGVDDSEIVPLYLIPGRADLIKEHTELVAAVRERLGKTAPALVVLDTLNKSLVGSENNPEDMSEYIRAAEAVREAFNCVVIIVHHCGYDETRLRGHSSLPGAVDAQLAVVRSENLVTATVEMMRDGPEGVEIRSAVEVIEVGQDENGRILASLVLVPTETPAATAETSKRGRRDIASPIFLRAMVAALDAKGETFQPETGTLPVHAVDQGAVRGRFNRWYADGEDDKEKSQAASAKAFGRALQSAVELRRVQKDVALKLLLCPGCDD